MNIVKLNDEDCDFTKILYAEGAHLYLLNFERNRLAERVVEKTNKYWELIYKKDEIFFFEKLNDMFDELPIEKVSDMFSSIFKDPRINQNDKDILWKNFNELVQLCCLYIHERRVPIKKEINGKIRGTYEKGGLYSGIKLREYVERYKLKLRFE